MPTSTQDEITRTAYHECGHAIAAILQGGQIDLLTIEPDQDAPDLPMRSGEIRVLWPDAGGISEKNLAIREIKVSLAGPIAEMIYDGTQFAPAFLEEWRYDWELAVDRAQTYLSKEKSVPEHLAYYAHRLLTFFERDDVWATLAALADLLEAHETLEPEDIEEILEAWPIHL